MKKTKLALFSLALLALTVSCVNENYDLTKVNKQITVAENVVIPVGETKKITIEDLLKSDPEMAETFSLMEDGTYKMSFRDSTDMSDDLPDFKELTKIDGATFSSKLAYTLKGLSPESFKYKALSTTREFEFTSITDIPNDAFTIPEASCETTLEMSSIPDVSGQISIPLLTPLDTMILKDLKYRIANLNVEKPSILSSVDTVWFKSGQGMKIKVVADNIPSGMYMKLKKVIIKFPSSVKASGANEDGIVTFSNKALPFETTVPIEYILPETVSSSVSFSGEMALSAQVSICGETTKTPGMANPKFTVTASGALTISDFSAATKAADYKVNIEPAKFSFEMPEGVSDFGVMKIIPKGSPKYSFTLNIPETAILMKTADAGLTINLPELVNIKDIPAGCTYDKSTRNLIVKGDIPKNLTFGLDYLLVDPKKDTDGKYYAKGDILVDGSLKVFASRIHKADFDKIISTKPSSHIESDPVEAESIEFEKLSVNIDKKVDVNLLKAGSLSKEIVSIGEVELEDTYFEFGLYDCNGLPEISSDKQFNVSVSATLPDWMEPNELVFNGVIKDKKFVAEPVKITGMNLTGLDLTKDITFSSQANVKISVDDPKLDVSSLSENISATVKGGINSIKIKNVNANIDFSIKDVNTTIDLSDMYGDSKDKIKMTLDLDNPYLMMDLKSNFGASVTFNAKLLPYRNGKAVASEAISFSATYPKCENIDDESHMKLFVAAKEDGMSPDYQFVKADLAGLIKNLPDSIQVSFTAITDKQQSATFIADADYKLSVNYEFGAPFKFGKDFDMSYCDTVDVNDAGKYLKYADVTLFGTVENKIPLQFEFKVKFLDGNGNEVKLDRSSEAVIKSCNSDGSACTTDFSFSIFLTDNEQAESIKKAVITLSVNSGLSAGVALRPDSYVKADLKLSLPEGLTLDFDNIDK